MKLPRFGGLVLLLTALSIATLPSCGGPTLVVQQYAGPQREKATIAIVRFYGDGDVLLVTLDGERADVRLEEDSRLHIEVLPGEHTVGVVSADRMDAPLSMVSFRAEAGKVYSFAFVSQAGGTIARAFEVDASSDARLRDVTVDKRPEPEPSRPSPPLPPPPPSAVEPDESDLPPPEPGTAPAATDGGAAAK